MIINASICTYIRRTRLISTYKSSLWYYNDQNMIKIKQLHLVNVYFVDCKDIAHLSQSWPFSCQLKKPSKSFVCSCSLHMLFHFSLSSCKLYSFYIVHFLMEITRIKHEILDGFFLYPFKLTCIGKSFSQQFYATFSTNHHPFNFIFQKV